MLPVVEVRSRVKGGVDKDQMLPLKRQRRADTSGSYKLSSPVRLRSKKKKGGRKTIRPKPEPEPPE